MRRAFLTAGLALTLVAPTVTAVATHAPGAGAVSTTPAWTLQTSGWDRTSSPTIADINGDGIPEIVIGHEDGYLRVLRASDGSSLPGWPQPVVVSGAPTSVDSTAAVADLFNNGKKEIIVGAGTTWNRHQNGGVVVFNANGTVSCRFRTRDDANLSTGTTTADGYSEGVYSSPAIGDINGDGYPDIAFGSWDRHVYAIDRFCHVILDDNVEDTVWSSPALYDANGDGNLDILIGSDQYAGGAIDWSGGEFRAISWLPGNGYRELWKRQIQDTVWSSPAVADIDGDGRPEVVVGAGYFYGRSDGHRVWAWHADDGSTVPGWPQTTGGTTMSSPAIGDVNGDGKLDVVEGSGDGYVYAFNGNGSRLWTHHMMFNQTQPGAAVASPIIADMNGDGHNDVGAGNNCGFDVLDGRNGARLVEVNQYLAHDSAGAIGNFGPGVGWRLIVDGFDTPNHISKLQAFSMPAPGTAAPWPMFRRDVLHHAGPMGKNLLPPGYCRRSGNPPSHPSATSSAGYWVLGADGAVYALHGAPFYGGANGRLHGWAVALAATRTGHGYYVLDSAGDIFTFGDAHSYGSMAGYRLNAPIIALAPTPTGHGYWLMALDGGVFSFGDARFYGSMGGFRLNAPIISIAATSTGKGYWLLASDGGVFSFGDARFHGSTGGFKLAAPIISMATAPSGRGYWLVARDGGIFSFGVPFYGSIPGIGLCRPASGVQIRPTVTGGGYFVLSADGRVFGFGDALVAGSAPPLGIFNFGTDLAVRP